MPPKANSQRQKQLHFNWPLALNFCAGRRRPPPPQHGEKPRVHTEHILRRLRLPHQVQVRPDLAVLNCGEPRLRARVRVQVLPRRPGEEKVHVAVLQSGAARRADCLHRRRPAADGVVPHEGRHQVRAVRRRLHARLHRSVPRDAAAAEPREGRARHLPARRAHLVACCVHGDAHSVQPLASRDANLRIHRHVRDAAGALNDIPDVRVSQE